ncbi:MAG: DNA polymerase III subunit delta' [Rhodanobacter sp.]|nr:MAG: DNA polymerase III subunit delta' [Rhodanobacter sp.]TAM14676.1 MAG: DNA polymerase III subunit delta' [Rhodanobacter sp.]TAM37468.1 MAG: DNA polymerase III subunit delta' [Rhodanobacter sp.]
MSPPWHADPWARLQARHTRGALPHALLFCGPAGLGKRGFVRRFARGLLCERPVDGAACGSCRTCRLLDAGTHPDLIEIGFALRKDGTPRTEIIVDQIRELSARLAMSSQFGGWKVTVIDPADAMNTAAANALLKTLEEPAAQTLLMLLADAPWRLPQTIRSRCQRVEFALPPRAQALAWLEAQGVTGAAAALDAALGNPGLAQAWSQSGALERRTGVRRDLAALASGRGEVAGVAAAWLADEPAQRLWFAAQAAADERRARAAQARPALGSVLADEALAQWYAAANRTRDRLRTTLRADLMLLELLVQWR